MVLLCLTLLADGSAVDALSGGAGWVGAGLLGAVLAWLMFVHLPAKDKQVMSLIEGRNEMSVNLQEGYSSLADKLQDRYGVTLKEVQMSHVQASQVQREDHKNLMQIVMSHCDKETEALNANFTKAMGEITEAVVDLRRAIEDSRTHPFGTKT